MLYRRNCLNCGQEFSTYSESKKFCCSFCAHQFKGEKCTGEKNSNLVEVKCAECGKIEYVSPSRAKKYRCCSVECGGKYNSKHYNTRVKLTCPICGDEYECKQSAVNRHRTCGKPECRTEWLKQTRKGKGNSRYVDVEELLKKNHLNGGSKTYYQHIVKHFLGLNSTNDVPKGYVIHHKDANHFNNDPHNLVVLPKTAHRLIHTYFGNMVIRSLHTGILDRETFIKMCSEDEWNFYKHIIDLDVTYQVVVKQGELLENPEEDNQQPSIYRNIIEGSTTNERVLPSNVEDSNFNTSALPSNNRGDDIV